MKRSTLLLIPLLFGATALSADEIKTFEELDTDGNGYLSKQEVKASKDFKHKWQKADKNGDGKIDSNEFTTFMSKGRFEPPEETESEGIGAAPMN